jgi:membrane protease YdiL (CAAX protease family)
LAGDTSVSGLSLRPLDVAPLSSGGTIKSREPSRSRRRWLIFEFFVLFLLAPILVRQAVHGERVPLFLALLPVLVVALAMLAADPTFLLRKELSRGVRARTFLSILGLFLAGGGLLTAWVLSAHPDWFLEFPLNRPETYQRIMIGYPIASVAAQELVYRTFYFHRYGPLFGSRRGLAILLNGVLFGFGHIVIGTWFSIIATGAAGTVLALRYAATRSYWAVFLEHTIWGWLIFTIGIGRFFFTGVSNV